jgi:hypothetical protein
VIAVIFRLCLADDVGDEYRAPAERMDELAGSMPGYIAHKTFSAPDGERVTIAELQSLKAVKACGPQEDHGNAAVPGESHARHSPMDGHECNGPSIGGTLSDDQGDWRGSAAPYRLGDPDSCRPRDRTTSSAIGADGSPVNKSGKIENGKTHVFRGPRARTGWGCREGPEEGWGGMGRGGLVASVGECKRLGRYPMCMCEGGGDVCLCEGDSQGGAPAPLGRAGALPLRHLSLGHAHTIGARPHAQAHVQGRMARPYPGPHLTPTYTHQD